MTKNEDNIMLGINLKNCSANYLIILIRLFRSITITLLMSIKVHKQFNFLNKLFF